MKPDPSSSYITSSRDEAFLREMALFVHLNPAPVFRFDQQGNVVLANESACELFEKNIVGQNLKEVWPEAQNIHFDAIIAKGQTLSLTAQLRNRWFQITLRGMKNLQFGHAYGSDITQTKETEKALRQTQQQLKLALTAGRLGTWTREIQENRFYVDSRWMELHGLKLEQNCISQEEWEARIHPEDREKVCLAFKNCSRPEICEQEYRIVAPEHKQVWLLDRGKVVLWDMEGQPQRMMGVTMDITRLKEAEAQLQRDLHLLPAIYDTAQVGICLTDNDGLFVGVNRSYCDLYGYSQKELIGQSFLIVVPPGFHEEARAAHERFFLKEQELPIEWTVVHKSGRPISAGPGGPHPG